MRVHSGVCLWQISCISRDSSLTGINGNKAVLPDSSLHYNPCAQKLWEVSAGVWCHVIKGCVCVCVLQCGVTHFWVWLWLVRSLWLVCLWRPWWRRGSCAEYSSISSLCPSERCCPPPSCSSCLRFSIHPPISTQTHWINRGSRLILKGCLELSAFSFFPPSHSVFSHLTQNTPIHRKDLLFLKIFLCFSLNFVHDLSVGTHKSH